MFNVSAAKDMATFKLKNGMQMLMRRATPDDAVRLMTYLKTVGGETDFLLIGSGGLVDMTVAREKAFLKAIGQKSDSGMFIGEVDGEIMACFHVQCEAKARIKHNATVGISVKRSYWHQGAGTACMYHLISFARESGTIRNLCLEVRADNARARKLYQRFGFVEIGRHKDRIMIDGVYYDEILMDLKLI